MSGNSDFVIENGVLMKYNDPGGQVVIPEGVTIIGTRAFRNCAAMTEVVIPESVCEIGADAFHGCKGLTRIFIPKQVQNIETILPKPSGVSWDTYINALSDNINKYKSGYFTGCDHLEWIEVDPENKTYLSHAGMLFRRGSYYRKDTPHYRENAVSMEFCPKAYRWTPEFPEGTTYISGFQNCDQIAEITIPEGVIGCATFEGCSNLKSIRFPSTLERLSYEMLEGETSLPEPGRDSERDFIFSIGAVSGFFEGCGNLERIEVDPEHKVYLAYAGMLFQRGGYSERGKIHYREDAFSMVFCPKGYHRTPKFPENTTFVSGFDHCGKITEVTLPEGVIECGSFAGCTNLRSIRFPSTIEAFFPQMFFNCPSLEEVILLSSRLADSEWISVRFAHLTVILIAPYVALSCLPNSAKPGAVVGLAKWISQGKTVSEDIWAEYLTYIRSRRKSLYPLAIEHEELMELLCRERIIPKEQFQELLEQSIRKEKASVTALLLEYQRERFPAGLQSLDLAQEFQKELRSEERSAKRNGKRSAKEGTMTITELKKIWSYKKLQDGTLCITSYKGTGQIKAGTEVTLPTEIGKVRVTELGGTAFSLGYGTTAIRNARAAVSSVIVPEGIIRLSGEAFSYPSNHLSVTLPASVVEIDPFVFYPYPDESPITIHAPAGSYAEAYAKRHNIPFQPLEGEHHGTEQE